MKTDARDLFLILLFFCRGLNQQTSCMFTGVSPKTHRTIIDYVSRVISAYNFKDFVDSSFDEAQADETAIGKRKYERGARRRESGVIWIAGLVQVSNGETKKMLAHVVAKRDAQALCPFIEQVTEADALVVTDGWGAYNGLGAVRTHEKVNHSKEFVNKEGFHTNNIEGAWKHLKDGIRRRWGNTGTHDVGMCNDRVQCGVFFLNCSLSKVNPLPLLLQLILKWDSELKAISEIAVAEQKIILQKEAEEEMKSLQTMSEASAAFHHQISTKKKTTKRAREEQDPVYAPLTPEQTRAGVPVIDLKKKCHGKIIEVVDAETVLVDFDGIRLEINTMWLGAKREV